MRGATRGHRLARGLQLGFDLAQHGQHFGRVRVPHQQDLALLHRKGVRTGVEIGLSQLARGAQRFVLTPDFGVGFL